MCFSCIFNNIWRARSTASQLRGRTATGGRGGAGRARNRGKVVGKWETRRSSTKVEEKLIALDGTQAENKTVEQPVNKVVKKLYVVS